jgi:hypothetical protein
MTCVLKIPPEVLLEICEWLDLRTLFDLTSSSGVLRNMLRPLCTNKLKAYISGYLGDDTCLAEFSQLELFLGAFIINGIEKVALDSSRYKYSLCVNLVNTFINKKKVEPTWIHPNFFNVVVFMDFNVKSMDQLLKNLRINGKNSVFCESAMEIDHICIFKTTYTTVYKNLHEDTVLCDESRQNCNLITYNIFA